MLTEPGELRVIRYPGAIHAMVHEEIERSGLRLPFYGIFTPRSLFAKGYLADLTGHLHHLDPTSPP